MKDLNYYLKINYPIKIKQLSSKDGGGWFAEIPTLPGCMSDGETVEDAINNLEDAKRRWLETSIALNCNIPEPPPEEYSGQLRLRMPKSLHSALAEKAREENVSLNHLNNLSLIKRYWLSRKRLGHSGKQAKSWCPGCFPGRIV